VSTGPQISKRSIRLLGHPTSVSLEDAFWQALAEIAAAQGRTVTALIADIDRTRSGEKDKNLSSLLRVYALQWYQQQVSSMARTSFSPNSSSHSSNRS